MTLMEMLITEFNYNEASHAMFKPLGFHIACKRSFLHQKMPMRLFLAIFDSLSSLPNGPPIGVQKFTEKCTFMVAQLLHFNSGIVLLFY